MSFTTTPSVDGRSLVVLPRTRPRWNKAKMEKAKAKAEKRRMLAPYDLSLRLRKLAQEGKIDEALELLQTSPSDAQNTIVWNTMILIMFGAKKYKAAYQLYVDVSIPCF